jgi:hypothetical protein
MLQANARLTTTSAFPIVSSERDNIILKITLPLAILLLWSATTPVFAQTSPPSLTHVAPAQTENPCGGHKLLLATLNRPTVGYSVCAVPKGSVVLEEGYQNTTQTGTAPSLFAEYPQGFERVGVAQRFELDLIGPNQNRVSAAGTAIGGASDMGVGFKYEFDPKTQFTYAIDGLYTAPTGSQAFTAGGPTETLNFDIGYSLSDRVGLATTLAAVSSSGPHRDGTFGRFGAFDPSFVVTYQTPHDYQFYAEVVGQTRIGPGFGGRTYTDFGVQKLLGTNVELDLEEGVGLTPVDGSRFTYTGVGFGLLLH